MEASTSNVILPPDADVLFDYAAKRYAETHIALRHASNCVVLQSKVTGQILHAMYDQIRDQIAIASSVKAMVRSTK